jgi:hypothetical protein
LASVTHVGEVGGDESAKLADAFSEKSRQQHFWRVVRKERESLSFEFGMLEAQCLVGDQQGGLEQSEGGELWGFAEVSTIG